MEVAKMIISVLLIIDCIVLTIVVLMQEGKEAGLGSISGMADTYWGKNKGKDAKVIATAIGVVLFLGLALLISSKILN